VGRAAKTTEKKMQKELEPSGPHLGGHKVTLGAPNDTIKNMFPSQEK
jgi:hypothetical protein